jgi:predicted transcriptional regulator
MGTHMNFGGFQERLTAHLRELVRSGEVTERGLARLTQVSQPHIHHVLKGKRLLSPETADKILRILRLDLMDLLEPGELLERGRR